MNIKEFNEIINQIEQECRENEFIEIENVANFNQEKVLNAFIANKVSVSHFNGTTGYGYDDVGRIKLNSLYSDIFSCEDAIVSPHLLSGTHAISTVLFGILRPNDRFLSITGDLYDTMNDIIAKKGVGSLYDFGVGFDKIDMIAGVFDYNAIFDYLQNNNPKLIYIQRSRGYTDRDTLSVENIANITAFIRKQNKNACIFVDNCYGEFTECIEPSTYVDLIAGSLIKNAGGGIARCGGYICGKKYYVELCANRLTTASTGNEIGAYPMGYLDYYQGTFLAPHVTSQALKGAVFTKKLLKRLGFKVLCNNKAVLFDVISAIQFNNADQLIKFCQMIQYYSPVDSNATPTPWEMPGYNDKIIMAAGCFISGSSIELSCDAPIKPPYILYLQGGLTYEHVKIAVTKAVCTVLNIS